MQEHFKDLSKMQEVLHEAQTGLWAIEMDEGKAPRMYADSVMLELLGFGSEPSPEECYQIWYDGIVKEYHQVIQSAVERICCDDRAEVEYPWKHPLWGQIFVRCGGVRDWSYQGGVCLRGYHQNITNTIMLKQEYNAVIQTLSQNYTAILLCNLKDKGFKIVKLPDEFRGLAESFESYEDLFRYYVEKNAEVQYRSSLYEMSGSENIRKHISDKGTQMEIIYRNLQGGWRRIRVVPASGYSKEYPWVIIALDEQDGEREKRISDLAAQAAVSQIYDLVISIDRDKTEYHCIYYSGSLMKLKRQGNYEDFYRKMHQSMPKEDQKELNKIFENRRYRDKGYREGVLRIYDEEKVLHYYNYYSTKIKEDMEERFLMTVRRVDEGQEMQKRENILANLCQCYYSIYLFDLDHDVEEAIWQEEYIKDSREFPKGSLKEYYEKFIKNFVYEEDQEKMRRAGNPDFLKQTLSEENPVYDIDFRRYYPDHIGWARSRFSIAEIKDGQVSKVIFANMNIHEQKLEQLEEEKRKKLYFEYQNIVQGFSAFYHSVFYVDLDKKSFQAFVMNEGVHNRIGDSDNYELLTEIYSQGLIQKEDQERFKKEMAVSEIRRRIIEGETIYALEYRRDYGGYYGWMRVYVILAERQNGVPVKVILAAHSVESEKEEQEQNRKALQAAYESAKNANEAKSKFLAQMSHDIRTPINAVLGMAEIAMSRINQPDKVEECLEKINISGRHLLSLINDILDMSKIEKGKIELAEEAFSLSQFMDGIDSMIRPEALEKGQEIKFIMKELIHDHVVGDMGRIRQVLINLINNAVKYTHQGGIISVTVQEVSERNPGLGCFMFTVEDNGIGISKEYLDYIFVPFSRANDSKVRSVNGTGLGMSIAQGIVSAMQGDIQVESAEGKGSRFIVTLNLRIAGQQEGRRIPSKTGNEPAARPDLKGLKGKRLLLAEDNELNMEITQTILQESGLFVDGAKNGKEALEMFQASKPGTYQAILMDLQMPVMDGYRAAREIRSSEHPQGKSIPVIALTANAFAEDITKSLAAGMNDHVSKPIDFSRLMEILMKNIEG